MSEIHIRRALISVYDKTGVAAFARALHDAFGIEIISTGGTATLLKESGVPVTLVESVTGFPEMMNGRVKTLHPKIHAGILADRSNAEHLRQLDEQSISPIDMVVVSLYPFEETIAQADCSFEQAIEMIDIGGPCMLRAAAKNHRGVLPVPHTKLYDVVLKAMREGPAAVDKLRQPFAGLVYAETSWYDSQINGYLSRGLDERFGSESMHTGAKAFVVKAVRKAELTYGENPHQTAGAYLSGALPAEATLLGATSHGAALSFNNYVDGAAALELVKELTLNMKEPRASARAAVRNRGPFSSPDSSVSAWLVTWTTYGQWLPGDERGFVSRETTQNGGHDVRNLPGTPYSSNVKELEESARKRMAGKPVVLTREQARVTYDAIVATAERHKIALLSLSVMENHVHVLCQSGKTGTELLKLFKGNSSRQLSQVFSLKSAPRWWTKSGSKRHIQKNSNLEPAVAYVYNQKAVLFAGRWLERVDAPSGAARAEARGSLERPRAAAFIKHTNPCGCAMDADPIEAYRKAFLGDPIAAAGGVLCVNFPVTRAFAETVMLTFKHWGKAAGAAFFKLDVWIAPSFDADALELIKTPTEKRKWGPSCRLLSVGDMAAAPDGGEADLKNVPGGLLVQTRDLAGLNEEQWHCVTKRSPTDAEMDDLRFAWLVCKHTKSNAITLVKDGRLLGNGAGQMSRVMSSRIAVMLAKDNGHGESLEGAVAAGDAFFPVSDGPAALIDAGVRAIIHPGGSNRDAETVALCDDRAVAMIMTGTRHFKH